MKYKYNLEKRNSLRLQKAGEGIYRVKECTVEESEQYLSLLEEKDLLPEDIIWRVVNKKYEFYKIENKDVIDFTFIEEPLQEIKKWKPFLEKSLTSIKNWMTFFGIITIISLIAAVISAILVILPFFGLL